MKRKKEILTGVALTMIYFIRILFLDADVNAFEIAQVQPIDELYYNEIAIKIYKYGWSALMNGLCASPSVANARTFFLPNILTAFSLKIFGNNFWGLKLPYVLMGYLSGLFLYILLKKIIPNKKNIHLAVMLSYVFDFNVFLLSREAVTVMPCMLACLIAALGIFMISNTCAKWFFLGSWSVISFCLIYMGLPFIFVAAVVLLTASFLWEHRKNANKKIIAYLAGLASGIAISELVSDIVFKQHLIDTIRDTLVAHGDKVGGISVFSSLKIFTSHFCSYWLSNVFMHNYLLLLLSMIAMVILLAAFILRKDRIAFVLLVFIGMHWAQTIFLDNMTASKATITYPIILLGISYVFSNYWQEFSLQKGIKRKAVLVIMAILSVGAIMLDVIINRNIVNKNVTAFFSILLEIVFLAALAAVWTCVLFQRRKELTIVWISTLCVMCAMSFYYTLYRPAYTDVALMTDLGQKTSNGMVINGKGFNLYNLCESPADGYDHYKGVGYDYETTDQSMVAACFRYEELYYIETVGGEGVMKLNKLLENTPYRFVEIKRYSRKYGLNNPGDHLQDQILYKKTKRG